MPPEEDSREPTPDAGALPLEAIDTVDCPNCGAPMRGGDTLVCVSCGYDMTSMSVVETAAGIEPAGGEDDEDDEETHEPAITRECIGGLALPSALATVGAIALIGGSLAGVKGLFPAFDPETALTPTIAWPLRLEFAARVPVLLTLATMCGVGALLALAWIAGRDFGDVRLAVTRMFAITAITRLVSFVDLPWPLAEFIAEAVGQSAVFILLAMLLFRLKLREAGLLLGLCVTAFVVLYLSASLVAWAM